MNALQLESELYKKIKVLNETIWEYRAKTPVIERWLDNFEEDSEKLHALFILSQFMYFGGLQMRELLKALYRDLFQYPLIEQIRIDNSDTLDDSFIAKEYEDRIKKTRFIGIGNPSESGTHLLYFFRQENKIPKDLFINSIEIFDLEDGKSIKLRDDSITHYVFIDDFCATGSQAIKYSQNITTKIKSLNSNIKCSYLMLFATSEGISNIRLSHANFDTVSSLVDLDDSFKCFSHISRYFIKAPSLIDKSKALTMCEKYGRKLMGHLFHNHPEPHHSELVNACKLGFLDSQLLIGFNHNTPDNTLPVIWYDEDESMWRPIFKRYNKIY